MAIKQPLLLTLALGLCACGGTQFSSSGSSSQKSGGPEVVLQNRYQRSSLSKMACGQLVLNFIKRKSIDPTQLFQSEYVAESRHIETLKDSELPTYKNTKSSQLRFLNQKRQATLRELKYLKQKGKALEARRQIKGIEAKLTELERSIFEYKIRLKKAQINSVFLKAASEERALILVPPQNYSALIASEKYVVRPNFLLARPAAGGILEGLFPYDQDYQNKKSSKEVIETYQAHISNLVNSKKISIVPYKIRGRTVVLRDGEERIVEQLEEEDLALLVLADTNGRPYIQGINFLSAVQKNNSSLRRPASRSTLDPYSNFGPGEEEVIKQINKQFQKISKSKTLIISQKLNSFSALDYPLMVYSPNQKVLRIHKGPVGSPHKYLLRFITKARQLGFDISIESLITP
ncbi:MAG: hypothetical protein HN509_09705 [Halobacteriovoraceae bacterium]|mgnify:CR=1 FL=1|jgi:hypothetical protein|nr:hypothetical protein [Halobacteriovoraceae bacterium]MBT5095286.1 hypothetical protein [Halobacteriovoraceae bacterium]